MLDMHNPKHEVAIASAAERRKFLAACGKFAIVTPPAMTLLLSTSLSSNAVTQSGGGKIGNNGDNGDHPNNGGGNGGGDGSPNGKPDTNQ
jgi:hypothetical protein